MKSIIITPTTANGMLGLKEYFIDCETKNYKKWGMNIFQFKSSQIVSNKYLVTENYEDKIIISVKEGSGIFYVDIDKVRLNTLKLLKKIYNVCEEDVNVELREYNG